MRPSATKILLRSLLISYLLSAVLLLLLTFGLYRLKLPESQIRIFVFLIMPSPVWPADFWQAKLPASGVFSGAC